MAKAYSQEQTIKTMEEITKRWIKAVLCTNSFINTWQVKNIERAAQMLYAYYKMLRKRIGSDDETELYLPDPFCNLSQCINVFMDYCELYEISWQKALLSNTEPNLMDPWEYIINQKDGLEADLEEQLNLFIEDIFADLEEPAPDIEALQEAEDIMRTQQLETQLVENIMADESFSPT